MSAARAAAAPQRPSLVGPIARWRTSGRPSSLVFITSSRRSANALRTAASGRGGGGNQEQERGALLATSALVTTAVISALTLTTLREGVAEFLFLESMSGDGGGFGVGDVVGGLLWAWSLYFTTPVQLVLLFFGRVEAERPSDLVLRLLGQAAKQPVDAVDYTAPLPIRVATGLVFVLAGLLVAGVLNLGLGDATWAVSSGLGATLASAVYELGRPKRLSTEEGMTLEAQFKEFEAFAQSRLQVSTRGCHESEVFNAFRRAYPRYLKPETSVSDQVLRDMVRVLYPAADRTSRGFYKGLCVVPAGSSGRQPTAYEPARAGRSPPTSSAPQRGVSLDPQELLQGGDDGRKDTGAAQAPESRVAVTQNSSPS